MTFWVKVAPKWNLKWHQSGTKRWQFQWHFCKSVTPRWHFPKYTFCKRKQLWHFYKSVIETGTKVAPRGASFSDGLVTLSPKVAPKCHSKYQKNIKLFKNLLKKHGKCCQDVACEQEFPLKAMAQPSSRWIQVSVVYTLFYYYQWFVFFLVCSCWYHFPTPSLQQPHIHTPCVLVTHYSGNAKYTYFF